MPIYNYRFIKYLITTNNGIEFDIIDTGGLPVPLIVDGIKFVGFDIIDNAGLSVLMTNNLEFYTKFIDKLKSNRKEKLYG